MVEMGRGGGTWKETQEKRKGKRRQGRKLEGKEKKYKKIRERQR